MAEIQTGILMHLGGSPDLGHLTYCTNIHAGESSFPSFAVSDSKSIKGFSQEIVLQRFTAFCPIIFHLICLLHGLVLQQKYVQFKGTMYSKSQDSLNVCCTTCPGYKCGEICLFFHAFNQK